tara:strand:+ start:131 stop:541 length:411 start_codon:yes stop_codon:yes gene_type:complete
MKKKTYNLLLLKKKISKNQSFKEISSLSKEKDKNRNAVKSLNDLLNKSKSNIGQLLTSSDLKNMSYFQEEIRKRVEISKSRENFLQAEIKSKMKELSKIKKQEEVVKNKIKDIDYLSNEETEKKTEITLFNKGSGL